MENRITTHAVERLEDKLLGRLDTLESKIGHLAHKDDLNKLEGRLAKLEERDWQQVLFQLGKSPLPWLIPVLIWLGTNWEHLWKH